MKKILIWCLVGIIVGLTVMVIDLDKQLTQLSAKVALNTVETATSGMWVLIPDVGHYYIEKESVIFYGCIFKRGYPLSNENDPS